MVGAAEGHRLVSVIPYDVVSPIPHALCRFSVYGMFLRDDHEEDLDYGMSRYDYHEGSLICVAPGQVGGVEEDGKVFNVRGWALLFSPELIAGTPLEKRINDYTFFSYSQNEALHLSQEERTIYITLLSQLRAEAARPADNMQRSILVNYLELLLSYCSRFYARQFATRRVMATDMLARFEQVLADYYNKEQQLRCGLPTVAWCAALSLSTNYFADMMKRETGSSPIAHIHAYIIRLAKNRLMAGERISSVAYNLGFDYPAHFNRLFKKLTGMTPSQYVNKRE